MKLTIDINDVYINEVKKLANELKLDMEKTIQLIIEEYFDD